MPGSITIKELIPGTYTTGPLHAFNLSMAACVILVGTMVPIGFALLVGTPAVRPVNPGNCAIMSATIEGGKIAFNSAKDSALVPVIDAVGKKKSLHAISSLPGGP
jgi:hypothetical protein